MDVVSLDYKKLCKVGSDTRKVDVPLPKLSYVCYCIPLQMALDLFGKTDNLLTFLATEREASCQPVQTTL